MPEAITDQLKEGGRIGALFAETDRMAAALARRRDDVDREWARLNEVIERSRAVLGVPDDYRIGIVAGSDTAAVEMALWSLLGARGVDVLAWDPDGTNGTNLSEVGDITGRALDVVLRRRFEGKGGMGAYLTPSQITRHEECLVLTFHDQIHKITSQHNY